MHALHSLIAVAGCVLQLPSLPLLAMAEHSPLSNALSAASSTPPVRSTRVPRNVSQPPSLLAVLSWSDFELSDHAPHALESDSSTDYHRRVMRIDNAMGSSHDAAAVAVGTSVDAALPAHKKRRAAQTNVWWSSDEEDDPTQAWEPKSHKKKRKATASAVLPTGSSKEPTTQRRLSEVKRLTATQGTAFVSNPAGSLRAHRLELDLPSLYVSEASDAAVGSPLPALNHSSSSASSEPMDLHRPARWSAEWQLLDQQLFLLAQGSALGEAVLSIPMDAELVPSKIVAAHATSVGGVALHPLPAVHSSDPALVSAAAPTSSVALKVSAFVLLSSLVDTAEQVCMREDEVEFLLSGHMSFEDETSTPAAAAPSARRSAWKCISRQLPDPVDGSGSPR
jgi:hypothetical protein